MYPYDDDDVALSLPLQDQRSTKIDVRRDRRRLEEDDFLEGLEDPAGFQEQVLPPQRSSFSRTSGGCSRRSNTRSSIRFTRSTPERSRRTGLRGAPALHEMGTSAAYDFMEEKQAEDAVEEYGVLPALSPSFEEELRHDEKDFLEGFGDSARFQEQVFQQQRNAFRRTSGERSRRADTVPSIAERSLRAGVRGAPALNGMGRQTNYDSSEEKQDENADEKYGALPGLSPPCDEAHLQQQQPPQQVVVVVPYSVEPPQNQPVMSLKNLTAEKIFFAIPPLILLVVLAVGLLRVLERSRHAGRTRAKFSARRTTRRHCSDRYRHREKSLNDTCTEAGNSEADSSTSSPTPTKEASRRNYGVQALLHRHGAPNAAATFRAIEAHGKPVFKSPLSAVLERKFAPASKAGEIVPSEASDGPRLLLQTRKEAMAELLNTAPLLIRRWRGSGATSSVRGCTEVSKSTERTHNSPQQKTLQLSPAPVVASVYTTGPPHPNAVTAAEAR